MHLAILTNVLSPYRAPLYNELARLAGEVCVFLSGAEDNRKWRLRGSYSFRVKTTRGTVLKRRRSRNGIRDFDVAYLHLPWGTIGDLITFRPDAVLSAQMGARSALAWLYCVLTGTPLLVHWGGTLHTEKIMGRFRRIARNAFFRRTVHAWVSYGSTTTEYLESLGVPRDRIFEATNCVDNEPFQEPVLPSLDLRPKPVLLFVGRFVPLKGLGEFLQAASVLKRRGRDFTILLVGHGPQEKELGDRVSRLGLQHVVFHPFVQQDKLVGLYRSADVMVLPTLQDVWGLVVNEALLSGVPVLCSKYAGCARDLVPETWQFDPLDIEGSFVPSLDWAIARGRAGRTDFIPTREILGPRQAAKAIMDAIEFAAGSQ
jgi:glycosyltransferase involved in cell wall biosynthesis